MEHEQSDFMGDSGAIETTTSSSGNHNGHGIDVAADGLSTDGEQLVLRAHDDVSTSLGERCFISHLPSI